MTPIIVRPTAIKKRETFRSDVVKVWDEYRASGLHISAVEADCWLAKLEAGKDDEPPRCHC